MTTTKRNTRGGGLEGKIGGAAVDSIQASSLVKAAHVTGGASVDHHVREVGSREPTVWAPTFGHLSLNTARTPYVYSRHQHPGYEVILVDCGVYRCLLNAAELVLDEGEILVVKPGDWHQDFLTPPVSYYGLGFHLAGEHGVGVPPPALFVDQIEPERQVVRGARGVFWPIVKKIYEEHHVGDKISSHVQDALLDEFFWRLLRALPDNALSGELLDVSPSAGFAKNIMRLFQSKVSESFSINEIAHALNMSASTLTRKCAQSLGMSPKRAFMVSKMQRAKVLLQSTSMSIKEISEFLRFKDQYHFSKVFKRLEGHPPSELR